MVRDLDLVKEFDNLYLKPVYLYGAGYYGKKTLKILNEMEVETKGVVDSNPLLRDEEIEGRKIYSIDDLVSIANKEDIIIIISTKIYCDDVVKILEKYNVKSNNIFTLFGLFYAIFFNINSNRLNKKVQEKIRDSIMAWKYNMKLESYYIQSYLSVVNPLFLDDTNPIIIYQPGKVGSNTLETTLAHHGVQVVRSHGILFSCEYGNVHELKKKIIEKIKNKEQIKMITLVREPIAKDIGHFFHKISIDDKDIGWIIKGIMEKNFQQSFLNFLSIVSPFDFTVNKNKEQYKNIMISHIDYIGNKNTKGALWGWYEEELKNNFGIDILKSDFDKEKGYGYMKCGNIELLILKLERINWLENVIGKFVGIDGLKLVNSNQAKFKSYKYAYRQFYNEVEIPSQYLDFCYKGNEYMNHFYTDDECRNLYEKWSKKG